MLIPGKGDRSIENAQSVATVLIHVQQDTDPFPVAVTSLLQVFYYHQTNWKMCVDFVCRFGLLLF